MCVSEICTFKYYEYSMRLKYIVYPQWPKMANHRVTKTSSGSKSYGVALYGDLQWFGHS